MIEKAFGRKAVAMINDYYYCLFHRFCHFVQNKYNFFKLFHKKRAQGGEASSELLSKPCFICRAGYTGIFIIIFGLMGCQSSDKERHHVGASNESVAFPDQVQAKYAEGFRITYHENYKLLKIIQPFQDGKDTLRYSLVPRELTDEVQVSGTREIAIPIRNLIATSTTHIGQLEMLDAAEVIQGITNSTSVYSKRLRQRIEQEEVIGFPQADVNKEKLIAMGPDLLMLSGGKSSLLEEYQVLERSGIALLVNAEWLETTPLGKAEWVKVVAALLNKERVANKAFGAVAQRYKELKAVVDTVAKHPMVINNIPYKGAWFVSGGNSYMAKFFKDAGADYPWSDNKETGGLRKDFEVVYEEGLKADVWLNPGTATTKEAVLAKDPRFKEFRPFITGEIYNNNKRKRRSGGNDYWESGAVHPERMLADLIKIFHPQVLPDYQLYYYQKVQ